MRRLVFLPLLAVVLAACNQVTAPEAAGRIEVRPGYVLLTQAGDSLQLSAAVFDGNDQEVQDGVTWHSSDPATVQVDVEGNITAVAAIGSAQVVARARGLESAPVLVVVAQTVPGAVLVSDDEVVGDVAPVDPNADYDLGWHYRVRLAGTALAPGDLVVGTGEKPVGGRVVAVDPVGSEQLATLEVVTLDELFLALELSESLDLSQVEPVISPELEGSYAVTRQDGAITLTPVADASATITTSQATGTTALGPFSCDTSTEFQAELTTNPTFTFDPSFGFDLEYDLAGGGLSKVAATGGLEASFTVEPKLTAAFEGSVKCEVELFVIPVPIGGPIAYVLGGQVPVGAGFELKGKVSLAELGFKTSAKGSATIEMGIVCPDGGGDCETFATGDATLDTQVSPIFPDLEEQFQVEAEFSGYAFADVAFGLRWSKKLRIQTLRLKASAVQKFELASVHAQVADPAKASFFDLRLLAQVKAGSDIEKLIKFLKLKISAPTFDLVNVQLARSPTGTFTITPSGVPPAADGEVGPMATFRVQLDPVTYLTADSVEKVEIFWRQEGEEGEFTLGPGRPGCVEIPAQSGQTVFECQADFLPEHEGVQTFYAFVHAKLFGVSVPVPLEVAQDGKATVNVDPDAVDPSICENIQGLDDFYVEEDQSGDGVASGSFRKVSARSNNGLAEAETYDHIAVLPVDETLGGKDGYMRVRFRYRFESAGPSETRPAARATLYPRKIYESFFVFEHVAGTEPSVVEQTVERDVHIRFANNFTSSLTSSPIGISAETFRSGGGLVKAEAEWLGIVSVMDAARNPVPVQLICTASGTDYQ